MSSLASCSARWSRVHEQRTATPIRLSCAETSRASPKVVYQTYILAIPHGLSCLFGDRFGAAAGDPLQLPSQNLKSALEL